MTTDIIIIFSFSLSRILQLPFIYIKQEKKTIKRDFVPIAVGKDVFSFFNLKKKNKTI